MSRLIAFGCSLTYGHGLPDCFTPPSGPGPVPSKHAWPQVIADTLGVECINLSLCGCSNKRMWHNLVNFKFRKGDVVFVMWSYPERFAIFPDKDQVIDIGQWLEDTQDESKYYQKYFYKEYDSDLQTKLYISHTNLYLKSKGIQIHNLILRKEYSKLLTLSGETVPHIPVYICDTYRHEFPVALDNRHPGIECNLEVARDILKHLKIKSNIKKQTPNTFIGKIKSLCKS